MKENKIEVGCLVRFLNAKGGGRINAIKGDMAYVEDEDGFDIPTPIRECVRVDKEDTFMPSYKAPIINKPKTKLKVEQATAESSFYQNPLEEKVKEDFVAAKPHQLLKAYGEVSASLYFFPLDESQMELCDYELYFVNECQYSFYYTISYKEQEKWHLLHHGCLLPKEEAFVEEIARAKLSSYQELNVQLLAYSENPKLYKGTFDIEFKLDLKKFRNRNTLKDSELFDDKAIIIPLVEQSVVKQRRGEDLAKQLEGLSKQENKTKDKPKKGEEIPLEKDRNGDYKFDLHIDELLDSTAGMDRRDILLYQLSKVEEILKANSRFRERSIVFIHGKGEGILRAELIKLVKKKFPRFTYRDASFSEYSFGATRVTIK